MKKIHVDLESCTGCRICEMTCSLFKEGVSSSRLARINVVTDFEGGISYPVPCYQCEDAPCLEACPVDAIWRDEEGIVQIDEEDCIGCGACVDACPFGSVTMHPDRGVAIKCDLCGGDPECVKNCPTDAIRYIDEGEVRSGKARETAELIENMVERGVEYGRLLRKDSER